MNKKNTLIQKIARLSHRISSGILKGDELVYVHRKSYYFLCTKAKKGESIVELIKDARKRVKKLSNAWWLFNEKGLYIIIEVESIDDFDDIDYISVDKSGFHAVILQGVHIIDNSSNEKVIQSSWFGKKFGVQL